jgi:signal transduction histidine kinase
MDLAMAKRIADEHEGQLSVQSAPGQGATFYLSLPLA